MAQILRGDIYWADLDPTKGHEQSGQRPVLILSNDVISEKAGTHFSLNGRKLPVNAENFQQLVKNGRIKEDRRWYLTTNFLRINDNDEVFVYTGDGDLGII